MTLEMAMEYMFGGMAKPTTESGKKGKCMEEESFIGQMVPYTEVSTKMIWNMAKE